MGIQEKYWKSLCDLDKSYNKIAAIEEDFPVNYYRFEESQTCIIIFKGSKNDCEEITRILNEDRRKNER
jgi:TATA-box binding protein (TBP) (component of TFIID and TFIIIB)